MRLLRQVLKSDEYDRAAFIETCQEMGKALPTRWQNSYKLFCSENDRKDVGPLPQAWDAYKKEHGDTGGEYDERARVARLEYLQAHAEALEIFHMTKNVPAWERTALARSAAAGGGGGVARGPAPAAAPVPGDGAASGPAPAPTAAPAAPAAAPATAPTRRRRTAADVRQANLDAGKIQCTWCNNWFKNQGTLDTHRRRCPKKPSDGDGAGAAAPSAGGGDGGP